MKQLLRVLGAAIIIGWYLLELPIPSGELPRLTIAISPVDKSSLVWSCPESALYGLYLAFDGDSLPDHVRTNFLNWKQPVQTNWSASLNVSVSGSSTLFQENLRLEPSFQSGDRFFFRVAEVQSQKQGILEITIIPRGNPPFGTKSLYLSLEPDRKVQEMRQFHKLAFWVGAGFCALALIFIFSDYARLASISAGKAKTTVM
jgi:hypothetical protein